MLLLTHTHTRPSSTHTRPSTPTLNSVASLTHSQYQLSSILCFFLTDKLSIWIGDDAQFFFLRKKLFQKKSLKLF